ncbi:hypothetical protein [Algoriphagus lacus]|nr:hypothetical protein [Algoriphagus lacus]
MKKEEFRAFAHQVVDWMADYLEQKESFPVTPTLVPKAIFHQNP